MRHGRTCTYSDCARKIKARSPDQIGPIWRCRGISNDATTPLHRDNRHIIDARGFISDHKYKYRIGGCLLIAILRLGVGERARAATELLRDWGEFSE